MNAMWKKRIAKAWLCLLATAAVAGFAVALRESFPYCLIHIVAIAVVLLTAWAAETAIGPRRPGQGGFD